MAIPDRETEGAAAHVRLWTVSVAMMAPAYVGMLVGAILIALAYANAATGAGQLHFYVFWLGVLLFLVPASAVLCAARAPRNARLALLVALGLFNYLPKLLRTPHYFLFHDELAHWRQAELIFSTGRLFVPNPSVYISQFFPGLQAMTVALRDLTGLSTFQLAAVLILCTHAAALLGIFVIAETLSGSHRIASIAALVYALNPGFMYFDTQYAYESIAFVYVIWTVAALIKLQQVSGDRTARIAWFGAGLALAVTCVITHHVSSYVLVVMLWLITGTTWLLGRRQPAGRAPIAPLLCFTVLVTLSALAWLVFAAPAVLAYLTQPVDAALTQLSHLLHHQTPSRTLFAHSETPAFERWSAYASVAIAGLVTLGGIRVLWRRQPPPALVALALFGLLYFGVMPLMLTGSGNEGARRSWTFSYIGLCMLAAPAVTALLAWARGHGRFARLGTLGMVTALLGVVQVGNVSMNINDLYRFPGPYVYGSDTRSTTAEMLGSAAWLRETQGTGKAVVADRYVSQILSSFALEWTPLASQAFPIWQLYFDPGPPSPPLVHELRFSHYQYLVVDERMAHNLPYLGVYFQDGEGPDGGSLATPPSRARIDRFERMPWAIKIYQSDNLSIYRLNLAAVPAHTDAPSPVQPIAPGNEIARYGQMSHVPRAD